MNTKDVIIGIDLGTTNSEVAALVDGRPMILGPAEHKMLPSCVGLSSDGQLLIGQAARNQMLVFPERTVKSVKRKMGSDERLELGTRLYSPSEVSALILRELVQWAQTALGTEVKKAVITVPAYFSDAQRQATHEAGELAGLEVVRILNEPTAASLAYGLDHDHRQTVMVYDLGGGTFDVSIVAIEGEITEVLASHGNNQLGGDDFDQLLLDRLLKAFEQQHGLRLEDRHPAAYSRLRWAAEEAKKKLSSEPYVRVMEEALVTDGGLPMHLDVELARESYEELIRPLLETTLDSVFQALEDAGKNSKDLDMVLLVGGSTRTPLVQRMLEERLGVPVRQDVHPDLCVALGASVLASRLAGYDVDRVLVDVSPYSFGPSHLGMMDNEEYPYCYRPIIKRNSPLPVTCTDRYYTAIPFQKAVEIDIFQGDDPNALKNLMVGHFEVEGLTPVAEQNEVLCRMSLDLNGILRVEAIEKRTGLSKHITISHATHTRSDAEIASAQARLQTLFAERHTGLDGAMDAEFETSEPLDVTDPESTQSEDPQWVISRDEAQRLVERSRALLDQVHQDDKEEFIDLHEAVQEALTSMDSQALTVAVGQLKELLFFIEGQ